MLVLSGLFLVLFILSLTVVLSIDYYKGNRNLFSFLAAISVLLITVVTEEVLLVLDINIENALILHIGMSISGTILLIRTAKVIASERAISVREKMLVELAFTDSLTGVHNRRSFDDFIDSYIHEGNPDTVLGILLCDINGLKIINDYYGHSNGDAILRDFSRKLTSMLPQGSIIYRIGGDEFVATIPNITNEQLELLCKDVFDIPNKGDVDEYSVAIGVRLYSASHSKDIVTLIKEADKAMYECKAKMKEGLNEPICKTAE
jgi:diguanylate cyclase (GGDEF)-like protein